MADPYLYEGSTVLRNKLDILDEKTLDLVEAEQSRAKMMVLYKRGFQNFSPAGLCEIHKFLFDGVYSWAGQYRIINITPELEHRKSGYVERKRRPYQGNVVRIA